MGGDSTEGDLSGDDRWLDALSIDTDQPRIGLVILWYLPDPERIGEIALMPMGGSLQAHPLILGRGDEATVKFVRIRPQGLLPAAPLEGRLLSRRQLEISTLGQDRLAVVNVGSCALKVGGIPVREATLNLGDVLEFDRQLVLMLIRRTPGTLLGLPAEPFGMADRHQIVGESDAAWTLRARLSFLSRRSEPVLVTGASGTGKELAARAIHGGSPRVQGPFVARNAATLPEGLVDAELFGNVRNYPNPGMPERPGLIGEADGGTLFLDEIGEMPEQVQAHLLRVLDRDGEYQRLGEARTRRASFRFVAATNRDPSSLKHDLAARLPLRIEVPGLSERASDIPLILRHMLEDARGDPDLAERLFDGPSARIAPDLLQALVHHPYTHHVRELQSLLWLAIETSPGRALQLTPELRNALASSVAGDESQARPPEVQELDAEQLQAALHATNGNVTNAAKRLGLSSRYTLYRLMRKHGLA